MSEDLVEYLEQHIQRGANISNTVVKALKKIEEEEGQDLSEVIQHLEIAEANFYAALNKMGDFEIEAISRVEARYRAMYNAPRNTSRNFIINLWKHFTK